MRRRDPEQESWRPGAALGEATDRVAFGRFELNEDRSELRCDGEPVRLGSKALSVLTVLVEQAGRFVAKDQLLAHVWPRTTVSDASVYTTLRELRAALGDDGRGQQLIETKRGRGYRLTVSARRSPPDSMSIAEIADRWTERTGLAAAPILTDSIVQRTSGRPEWVDALIEGVAQERASPWNAARLVATTALPRRLYERADERLAGLDPDTHQFLRAAATLGGAFEPTVALELAGGREADLDARLDAASTRGFIEPDPHELRRMRFSDPSLAEGFAAGEPLSERASLHASAALLLAGRKDDRELGQRAALHALRSNLPAARIFELCLDAARASIADGAREDGLVLLHAAVTVAKAVDVAARYQALIELGDALFLTGDPDSARKQFGQAIDLANELDDPTRLAEATLGFAGTNNHVDTGLASTHRTRLIETALRHADRLSTSLVAALRARLALELAWAQRPTEARRMADLARAAIDRGEVSDALASRALHDVFWSTWSPDNLEDRIAIASAMRDRSMSAGQTEANAMAVALHAAAMLERGERVEADSAYLSATERVGPDQAAIELLRSGREVCMALLEGRFDEVEGLAIRAHTLARANGSVNADTIYAAQIGWLRFDQGRLGELVSAVAGSLDAPRFEQRAGRALIFAYAGRGTEARRELDDLVGHIDAIPRDSFWMATLTMLIEIAAHLGASDAAGVLYERLLPYADRAVLLGIRTVCRGSAELYLGLAARAQGAHEQAQLHFERAAQANARLRAAPLLARSLLLWADCTEQLGASDAVDEIASARDEAQRIRAQLGLATHASAD